MAKVLITESLLEDIADAIRDKNGTENTYKPGQMAAAVEALPDPSVLDSKSITANGTYDPSDDDLDGYDEVTVNVPNSYAVGDEGKVLFNGALVAQTSAIKTENGTYDTTLNNEVVINVSNNGHFAKMLIQFNSDDGYSEISEIAAAIRKLYVFSEGIFINNISVNNLSVTGATLSNVTRLDDHKISVDFSSVSGQIINIELLASAFLFSEGGGSEKSVRVSNTLSAYMGNNVGLQVGYSGSRVDAGNINILVSESKFIDAFLNCFNGDFSGRTLKGTSLNINSDSYLIFNGLKTNSGGSWNTLLSVFLGINKRDNSYTNVYYGVIEPSDYGKVIKIRWEGNDPYDNPTVNSIWEAYLFEDGGIMVYIVKAGNNHNGIFALGMINSSKYILQYGNVAERNYRSLYIRPTGKTYANEMYQLDSSLIPSKSSVYPQSITLNSLIQKSSDDLMLIVHNWKIDTPSISQSFEDIFSFPIGDASYESFVLKDCEIGINGKNINMGVADGSLISAYCGVFTLTDIEISVARIDWLGVVPYDGSSVNHQFEVYLFSNGDIMVHVTQKSGTGNSSVFGNSYIASNNSYISFYRTSKDFSTCNIEYEVYDISKHVM